MKNTPYQAMRGVHVRTSRSLTNQVPASVRSRAGWPQGHPPATLRRRVTASSSCSSAILLQMFRLGCNSGAALHSFAAYSALRFKARSIPDLQIRAVLNAPDGCDDDCHYCTGPETD